MANSDTVDLAVLVLAFMDDDFGRADLVTEILNDLVATITEQRDHVHPAALFQRWRIGQWLNQIKLIELGQVIHDFRIVPAAQGVHDPVEDTETTHPGNGVHIEQVFAEDIQLVEAEVPLALLGRVIAGHAAPVFLCQIVDSLALHPFRHNAGLDAGLDFMALGIGFDADLRDELHGGVGINGGNRTFDRCNLAIIEGVDAATIKGERNRWRHFEIEHLLRALAFNGWGEIKPALFIKTDDGQLLADHLVHVSIFEDLGDLGQCPGTQRGIDPARCLEHAVDLGNVADIDFTAQNPHAGNRGVVFILAGAGFNVDQVLQTLAAIRAHPPVLDRHVTDIAAGIALAFGYNGGGTTGSWINIRFRQQNREALFLVQGCNGGIELTGSEFEQCRVGLVERAKQPQLFGIDINTKLAWHEIGCP